MAHASFSEDIEHEPDDELGGKVRLFIGPPHDGTEREIEVLARWFPGTGREAHIFHAMWLGSKWGRYRQERESR